MTVAAVVSAVERGERAGSSSPGAFRSLRGLPLLAHAVGSVTRATLVDLVVIAASPDDLETVHELVDRYQLDAETPGALRTDGPVAQAVLGLPPAVDTVLIHDATRPLVPADLVDAVVRAVQAGADAVVPAVPVADTVKETDPAGRVLRTVDRSTLRTAQAPRGFRRDVLCKAYASRTAADDADELGLVQQVGGSVVIIPGAEEAILVARPSDLALAEVFLETRERDDRD